jgi:hypothetical protein
MLWRFMLVVNPKKGNYCSNEEEMAGFGSKRLLT